MLKAKWKENICNSKHVIEKGCSQRDLGSNFSPHSETVINLGGKVNEKHDQKWCFTAVKYHDHYQIPLEAHIKPPIQKKEEEHPDVY